ncbi:MAG: hypothetical protein J0I20_21535 [Chloroflexi bacterium]|nr:hypothetical protein [Chloroflexota bacterium]
MTLLTTLLLAACGDNTATTPGLFCRHRNFSFSYEVTPVMKNHEVSYPRLIAANTYGWCVYRQATDRVHFDFGQTGLLLTLAEFKVLGAILEDACHPRVAHNNGLMAGTSSTRAIFSCSHHQVAVLIFDHAVFRFQSRDLPLLLELWNQAASVFELNATSEIVEYSVPDLTHFSAN